MKSKRTARETAQKQKRRALKELSKVVARKQNEFGQVGASGNIGFWNSGSGNRGFHNSGSNNIGGFGH